MRKNFLLLFLLTLMPFSAFAAGENIVVTPTNASKTYGEADRTTAKPNWFSTTPADAYGEDVDDIALALSFIRLTEGENVGTYSYTLESDDVVGGHNLAVSGTSTFTIKKKSLTDFVVDAVHDDYTLGTTANNKITVTWKKRFYTSDLSAGDKFKPTASDFEITVDLEVPSLDGKLVAGTDYEVLTTEGSYGTNNTVAGNATKANYITIQGKGNYTGTIKLYFTVEGSKLVGTPKYIGDELYFTGTAYDKTYFNTSIADKFELANCVAGTDFTVTNVENGLNAGTATVTLSGKGAYAGDLTVDVTIKPVPVTADLAVTLGAAPVYTGSPVAPVITSVKTSDDASAQPIGDDMTLEATDYEISELSTYAKTGTYTPTFKISFKGNFTGDAQVINYDIDQFDLSAMTNVNVEWTTATIADNTFAYNGTELVKPAFTLTYKLAGDTKVYTLNAADFQATYQNGDASELSAVLGDKLLKSVDPADVKTVEIGDVTYEDIQNYTGTFDLDKAYTVAKRPVTVKANDINVALGINVTPAVVYSTFPKNVTKTTLDLAENITFVKLDAEGNETGTVKTLAQVNDPATQEIGIYNIHVELPDGQGGNDAAKALYAFAAPVDGESNPVYGKLTVIANQIIVKLKNRTIEYGDALPQNGWEYEHVSGLSEENRTGANFAAIIGTPIDEYALVNGETFPLAVNADGYTVNFNGGKIVSPKGYTITVQPAKLIVTKKLVSNLAIEFADATYTGKAINPFVTIKQDIAGVGADQVISTSIYNVDYDKNFNAGNYVAKISCETENYTTTYEKVLIATDPEVKAGTNKVGDKVIRTYIDAPYTIKKKALTITPADFTGAKAWKYGTDKSVFTSTATITGLVDADASKAAALLAGEEVEGFNGTLNVQMLATATIGDHAEGLQAKFIDKNGSAILNGVYATAAEATAADAANEFTPATTYAADNYYVVATKAALKIAKGDLVLKVKNAELPYGEVANNSTFELEVVSGMDDAEERANFNEIVSYEKAPAKFGYVAANFKDIKSYSIAYEGTAPTATNYNISFAAGDAAKGTLTVTKRPVKFQANNKTVNYGDLATAWVPAVNGTYVSQVTEAGKFYSLLKGDKMTDLISAVNASSLEIGENEIVLTAKASEIYDITVVPGVLTINATGVGEIVLNRVAKSNYDNVNANTAARLIEQRDGQICNVKFSDFPMIGEKWYPLVLPFATSVKEISKAFGYAVVDIFNGTTADGKISFKLHMGNIAANTPFIVKVYEDMNMADASVVFNYVKIENGMDANGEVKVNEGSDVDFVGSYKGRIEGFRSNMYYFSTNAELNEYYKGNDTNKTFLRPLAAYFVDNAVNAANTAREILIEEADGSTTAISSVSVDGALVEADGWYTTGGVKLQGVPTEKGVYIRNGKKIVIK